MDGRAELFYDRRAVGATRMKTPFASAAAGSRRGPASPRWAASRRVRSVDDFEVSYVFRARGWRTLYLNEALARPRPESVPEYIKQRVRWCSGTIQHAFLATARSAAAACRCSTACSTWSRSSTGSLSPSWFCFCRADRLLVHRRAGLPCPGRTGCPAAGPAPDRRLPRRLLDFRGEMLPVVSTIHKALPAFHLTAPIFKSLLAPFGRPFQVTAKGQATSRVVVQWGIAWIFLARQRRRWPAWLLI